MIQKKTKLARIISGALLLSTPFIANAAIVDITGGTFTANITIGSYDGFYDSSTNSLENGTAFGSETFASSAPASANFTINDRDPITNPAPSATGSRGRTATSYSFDDTSTTLAELQATDSGMLGFTGVTRFGAIVGGDANLDQSTFSGTDWSNLANTIDGFAIGLFDLTDILLVSIGSGGFELSGNLVVGAGLGAFIPEAGGSAAGTFSIIATAPVVTPPVIVPPVVIPVTPTPTPIPPSAVPVPAAVWLFGTGLLGLIGVNRKNKKA